MKTGSMKISVYLLNLSTRRTNGKTRSGRDAQMSREYRTLNWNGLAKTRAENDTDGSKEKMYSQIGAEDNWSDSVQ